MSEPGARAAILLFAAAVFALNAVFYLIWRYDEAKRPPEGQ